MSMYLRLGPFVKLRLSRRRGKTRVRAGLGPRVFRQWFGAGGRGTSAGFGPFTWYIPARRRRAGSRRR